MIAVTFWWALLALYTLLVLRWAGGHATLRRALRAGMVRAEHSGDADTPRPSVCVIIAAHNEQAGIQECLERIVGQGYPNLRVIVANDRSTDATPKIIADLARRHSNISLLNIDALPAGWLGKTHAVARAARDTDAEYLVFTDADVEWRDGLLLAVVNLAQRERLDFLSLWPRVVVDGFWERVVPPVCGLMLSLWFENPHPGSVEHTPAFANGQFLMIRRDAYERLGGHTAVRDELAEDVALARLARQAGLRRFLGHGCELLRTRMYENLTQIVHGWTRIFIGSLGTAWKLLATMLIIIIGQLSFAAVLISLAVRAASGGQFDVFEWLWLGAALLHYLAMYTLVRRYGRSFFAGGVHAALLPLGSLSTLALLAYCLCLINGVGRIRWGSMRYRVHGGRIIRPPADDDAA